MLKQDPAAPASDLSQPKSEAKSKWEEVLKETAQSVESPEAKTSADEDVPSNHAHPEVSEGTQAESENASDYATLKKALEEANSQIVHLQEKLQAQALYAAAELQDSQRKASRDIEKAKKYSGEKTIEAFLPLIDSYEKSMEQTTTVEQFQEGTQHIIALMHHIFEKLGVKVLNPQVGEVFDPHYHEAVATEFVDSEKQAPNTIFKVFQKGYALHDRLVRPAMVVVSKVAAD
jgi:molecular chaperone GrpE